MTALALSLLISRPPCPLPEEALPVDVCPAVFGDEGEREALADRREELLLSAEEGEHAIDVVHRSLSEEPTTWALGGAEILAVRTGPACEPVALVALDVPFCEAGLYAVPRDTYLGELRVLAVVPSGLLLGEDDALGFVPRQGAPRPVFRMTWVSSWRLPPPRRSVAPMTKPPPRAPPRRR